MPRLIIFESCTCDLHVCQEGYLQTKRYFAVLVCIALLVACSPSEEIYMPGTYKGLSEGYYSVLKVSVVVDAYRILDINIISHEEPEILSKIVFEELPPKIIKKNNTDIEGISGATYTSASLLDAVEKALEQARR